MKKLSLILLFLTTLNLFSQVLQPVKWTTKTEKISETEFNLVFEAKIEKDWHVYSQFTPENGPLPIVIDYKNKNVDYQLIGKTTESKYQKKYNDIFEVDEYYFENNFKLVQKVKILKPTVTAIKVKLEYQTCKDACINDIKNFTFEIPKQNITTATASTPTTIATENPIENQVVATTNTTEVKAEVGTPKITENKKEDEKGLWKIFFLAFLGGFAALLTPCVFPMIPLTVSFFTKQSKNRAQGIRNAIIYGLSIIFIYVVLGLTINAIFGADALSALSTNVWFNVLFFMLLVLFAASFLGAFELVLPYSWANKIDRQADKGGFLGIFFMALALAVVSFSCTGPIVGTLLVESASKGGIAPIVGMLGFSSALALPFMLFALFPSWLNSLPKSGGWMNTVKASLGFLELALAFKFLSNADLVLQLHYLERETFIAIWIAIFGTWALYLFGKISLPHDSPLQSISVGRLFMGLLVLSFTIYMLPGLTGAPLKLISAFPPPENYSERKIVTTNSSENLPKDAEIGPHQLVVFTDYDKGMAYAKTVHKPVLLDFTGHACVNCRKMENNVWSDDKILPVLKNDLVIISLFADDKRELPKSEQTISKSTGAEIVTIGDKWTDFMITKYKTNTQPLYVLIDNEGNNLNTAKPTASYDPDIDLYLNWLKDGLKNYK